MIHFTTFFALVVGGMEVIQPAAAGVAGLTARIHLGSVNAFQRRQIPQVPPACESICNPINGILSSGTCPPSQCCLASFETAYFNCFACVAASVNLTDYSAPQAIIDKLYDQCASIGMQLPVLTFPGQNPSRPLSSVVQKTSSQTTISSTISTPTTSIIQTTIPPTTSIGTSTTTPTPSSIPTSSSGTRTTETGCFNLIAGSIMLGTWFHFAM